MEKANITILKLALFGVQTTVSSEQGGLPKYPGLKVSKSPWVDELEWPQSGVKEMVSVWDWGNQNNQEVLWGPPPLQSIFQSMRRPEIWYKHSTALEMIVESRLQKVGST